MRGRSRPLVAFVVGYGFLALAWAMAQPPFKAPDESAHFVRVLGVAEGQFVGRQAAFNDPAATPLQHAWAQQSTRAFDVPADLSPGPGPCVERSRPCRRVRVASPVGTYQPLPYLLPAALANAGGSATSADRLARLGGLLPWLLLITVAAVLLWDSALPALSLAGLAVAATPMVVFTGATLNGSGLEIVAGLAFAAGLIRCARDAERASGMVIAATAGSGALLALSRSTGPLWIAIDLALLVLLVGGRRVWRVVAASRLRWALGAGFVLLAVALNRLWEAAYGPSVTVSLRPVDDSLHEIRIEASRVVQSSIGWFGALQVKPPLMVYLLWGVMALGLVVLAWTVASRQQRGGLLLSIASAILIPVLLIAGVMRHTGFPLQGRHVLPLIVIVPLLAGELARANAARLSKVARAALPYLFTLVGALQALCFYAAARFAAVGADGSWWFLGHASWKPPLGWPPWLLTAFVGAAALALAGSCKLVGDRSGRNPSSSPNIES